MILGENDVSKVVILEVLNQRPLFVVLDCKKTCGGDRIPAPRRPESLLSAWVNVIVSTIEPALYLFSLSNPSGILVFHRRPNSS